MEDQLFSDCFCIHIQFAKKQSNKLLFISFLLYEVWGEVEGKLFRFILKNCLLSSHHCDKLNLYFLFMHSFLGRSGQAHYIN